MDGAFFMSWYSLKLQEMNQPNLKLAVPFLLVTDMERSIGFYVNGLGFILTNTWTPHGKIEWCWLTRDLISIMLQERLSAVPRIPRS